MRRSTALPVLGVTILMSLPTVLGGYQIHQHSNNYSPYYENSFGLFQRADKDCPPCFNCNLDDFRCHQFAECNKGNGRCECPSGFGGDDCSLPLCQSLADGHDRSPPKGKRCWCKEGWTGVNCNVCKTDDVCDAMMPEEKDGVCYTGGDVVKENFQTCDITNRKILDQLKDQIPQATFSCNAEDGECSFQFWVDKKESFYCALDTCSVKQVHESDRNITTYHCDNIKCRCIPGRMLCGENGSVNIGEFLEQSIKGPATFESTSTEVGSLRSRSEFHEPEMDNLILSIFGDEGIFLNCRSGECVHRSQVPGYERPIKKINTPLIAGVIAGVALLLVLVILTTWYLIRRAQRTGYGPIALTDEDEDEAAKLLADHKPAALYFNHVSYRLDGKPILSGISGAVHPGELLAIMGASGAGKTTFLDILARKNKRGDVDGDFYLNGEKVLDEEFRSVIGFVDQEDTLLPTLTVHETIMDSALLRLPKDMSLAAKEQKVEDVEKQLGIYPIRHQTIGSEEGNGRGISGGEKRRVGIACELVTSPSILFLDEPTSGLDAFNAFNVVECLVNLVKSYNRTVVFTIHQPRSNIVALFDHLILLAKGRTVYSGPFASCQPYFDQIGYACPPGFNIADYLVDLTMHASVDRSPIAEDSSLFSHDDAATRASSAVAVKSIPSVSGASGEMPDSPSESLRPRYKRKVSVKQQQDRKLFTRKPAARVGTSTPRTDDELSLPDNENPHHQWLRLSRQDGVPPPQILDDPDELPPPANGATGTNLDLLVAAYKDSDVARSIHDDITLLVQDASNANGGPNGDAANHATAGRVRGYHKVGLPGQFVILSLRTWRNLYRNPMLMLTHYAIAILLAVFLGFLFYGITDDIPGFQNRMGLFFFVLALFGFSTLTTLTVFSSERLLFTKERAKGYYSPLSFFAAKVVFDIVPLRLLPPIILSAIIYPMTGLVPAWPQFLKFVLFLVLFNLAAAAICLFIGIIFKNGGMANLIGSMFMLFSLLFSGFFINRGTIPPVVKWLQYLSIFHYAFEGIIVNETRYLSLVDRKYGIVIEVPGSAILSTFGFKVDALWSDVIGLAVYCAAFIVLGYGAMHILLKERR